MTDHLVGFLINNKEENMSTVATREAIQPTNPNLLITEPGQLRVISRKGELMTYDDTRISVAIKKAYIAVEGDVAENSKRIQEIAAKLTQNISDCFNRRYFTGGTIHIEAIQDQVELELMRAGERDVASAYVLYREKRRQARDVLSEHENAKPIHVILENGQKVKLNFNILSNLAVDACQNLTHVNPTQLISDARKNLFDGVAMKDVYKAIVMSARTLIESDITAELLNPNLKEFDLDKLGKAIDSTRDLQFTYLGIQTLYDRYFIHLHEKRIEMPQVFFMRVAMGLAHCEGKHKNERAIEFYNLISSFDYMSSTPTLFNSGTMRPQLSSCYLTTVPDHLEGIYSALKDNALLSKFAGGLGNDWTPVRAMGAYIKGTNGKSLGVVPFLNVAN